MNKLSKHNIINHVNNLQLKKDLPNFQVGDTVSVSIKIADEKRTRIQKFDGLVLRRKGSGLSETFIVRKESSGVGVEKNFHVHNPNIEIELKRKGKVRRAYISYMRERSGKSARIKEKVVNSK